MSRELRDLLEQTARGPCDRDFDPSDIAAKAGRQRRLGAVAAAVVVLAAVVGGAAWVRSLTAGPQAPFVDASPPEGVPRAGWQTLTVGSAHLSVPQDWPVIDLRDDPTAYCTMFKGTPSLYLGPVPQPPPPCPNSLEGPVVGVHAVGFAELGGRFDGEPVEVNGHEGVVTDDDGQSSSYVFPDLAVMLEVSYGPDPQLAEQVLSTLRRAEGDTVEPSPAQPSAARSPAELDPGVALTTDGLPAMGPEGVAVQTAAGVVFVGIDGTVHGHLPGAELNLGSRGRDMPGLVPVLLPVGPEQEPEDSDLWIQPATGTTTPLHRSTPLRADHQVTEQATGRDPSPLILEAPDGRQIAQFSPNLRWKVSAGHRVTSWMECPEDAGRDLSRCDSLAFDTDTRQRLQFVAGCWVSDSSADQTHAIVCSRGWSEGDGTSWIERRGPGQAASRIPVPRREDESDDPASTGQYLNAFLEGDNVVATWRAPCEPSTDVPPGAERDSIVIATSDGRPRPLIGNDLATSPAARVLGITRHSHAVVHVLSAPECGLAGQPGIHLVDPRTGDMSPVIVASVEAAEMWIPQPTL